MAAKKTGARRNAENGETQEMRQCDAMRWEVKMILEHTQMLFKFVVSKRFLIFVFTLCQKWNDEELQRTVEFYLSKWNDCKQSTQDNDTEQANCLSTIFLIERYNAPGHLLCYPWMRSILNYSCKKSLLCD